MVLEENQRATLSLEMPASPEALEKETMFERPMAIIHSS